jgi:hypothetical protein
MNTELFSSLLKFAASDLRTARKQGDTLIGQTQRGTLSLSYVAGVYTLATVGLHPVTLASGKPSAVKPVLADLYDVA